jgi:hypothetical protein
MEPPGTLFGVFRFSLFPFWKGKNKKIEPDPFENTAEFRIWNHLEFLGFCFFKNLKFLLVVHQISNSDRSQVILIDRLKINFSFSLNSPFQCSVSGILYGKNRKYRSQPYKNSIALESTLNKSPGLNEKTQQCQLETLVYTSHRPLS